MIRRVALGLALAALGMASVSQAATLTVDDSDPNTMTITWDGFVEGTFSVLDNSSTEVGGFGAAGGSVTLVDGAYALLGEWLSAISSGTLTQDIWFAPLSTPNDVTSGIVLDVDWNGTVGSLAGNVVTGVGTSTGGYTGGVYFNFPGLTYDQAVQQTVGFLSGGGGLTGSFTSEAAVAVPEPATVTLVGMGALGLIVGAYRRRRQAA